MSWKKILKADEFCDECGDKLEEGHTFPVESMPQDFNSGKKGESATLCEICYNDTLNEEDDRVKTDPNIFEIDDKGRVVRTRPNDGRIDEWEPDYK